MKNSSPIVHRAQRTRSQKFQSGTILSHTILAHAPTPFQKGSRCIGLIELDDGSKVLAPLLSEDIQIGQQVLPRMRLSCINPQGLRIYDVVYEVSAKKSAQKEEIEVFPRYILAFSGPSGVGKSTVSALLAKTLSGYVQKVPILTTRAQKEGDDGEYQYISPQEFRALEKKGEIVAATHIPSSSENRQYGYRANDIEKIWEESKIPVVVTEMHLLQGLSAHFGRRSVVSFGLLPPGKSRRVMLSHLLHRLRSRGRDTEEQIRDRLKNAKEDLQFFQKQKHLFDHILVNEDLDSVLSLLKGHIAGLIPGIRH